MGKWIGAVIFPDGDRRFIIWNTTVDFAWPPLFDTSEEAEAALEAYDQRQYDPFAVSISEAPDQEPAAVFSWADQAASGKPPFFVTTASRQARVITGPRCLDDASETDTWPPSIDKSSVQSVAAPPTETAEPYRPLKMSGRCATGAERDKGSLYHAVPHGHAWTPALCGATPGGRGNGWSTYVGDAVTCRRCLKRLT